MAADSLDQLARDLSEVTFVPGTEAAAELNEQLERAQRLLEIKLAFELRRPPNSPPLVVIAGGTNVGKSTVFNWVVGDAVASSSPLARHTKAPTVYVHRERLGCLADGAFLPSYRRLTLEKPEDAAAPEAARGAEEGVAFFLKQHEQAAVQDVVLVDSPDIDSTHAGNRTVAEDLLFLSDAVVFVATPEKYNDELCVSYLRQAGKLEKAMICVLNKGADAEVERDFREVVIPGLEHEARVLTMPYISEGPQPDSEADSVRALREAILTPGSPEDLRRDSRRGAAQSLGTELSSLVGRMREELGELDRIRAQVDLVLEAKRDDYQRFLSGVEFYELDRVFERVLTYFRIPVLDSVYDGMRNAFGFVGSGLTKLVTGRPAQDSRSTKLKARAETDRQQVKDLLESARTEALELPYRHAGVLREAVPRWLEDEAGGRSIEDVNQDVESYLQRAEAETERWIELQTQAHVARLEEHPYARNTLRALKGFFQVGFGLLSATLTGGFGPWDLVIGTATERATKALLESMGGYLHYQKLKIEFSEQRAELFLGALQASVGDPLRARLPSGVDPERLERLSRAAATLSRGEVPGEA